jgi:hypothetical protein
VGGALMAVAGACRVSCAHKVGGIEVVLASDPDQGEEGITTGVC